MSYYITSAVFTEMFRMDEANRKRRREYKRRWQRADHSLNKMKHRGDRLSSSSNMSEDCSHDAPEQPHLDSQTDELHSSQSPVDIDCEIVTCSNCCVGEQWLELGFD